jgi:hypothetical protein
MGEKKTDGSRIGTANSSRILDAPIPDSFKLLLPPPKAREDRVNRVSGKLIPKRKMRNRIAAAVTIISRQLRQMLRITKRRTSRRALRPAAHASLTPQAGRKELLECGRKPNFSSADDGISLAIAHGFTYARRRELEWLREKGLKRNTRERKIHSRVL